MLSSRYKSFHAIDPCPVLAALATDWHTDSDQSGSSGDYSDASSSESDVDVSDEETLAHRHSRHLGKRSAGSHDQGQPAKRRRSSSDSGSAGSGSNSSRKRRNLFPTIRRAQRCGTCHTCLNPQLKKACMTVREQMMKDMQGSSKPQRSSKASVRPAQQPLSPAGSADLDQDKYVDLLEPLIDDNGGLKDSQAVSSFVETMGCFKTTLSRILPASVLGLTRPSLLSDFMAAGGVDTLAVWILAAEGEDSASSKDLLKDILQLMQKLPVTKVFVQSTKSAKVIGSLRKSHPDRNIRDLAQQVVKLWMRVIPPSNKATSGSSTKPAAR